MEYFSLMEILRMWKSEVGYAEVMLYTYREGVLTIYTIYPGYLIGGQGKIVDKYAKIISKKAM